MTRKPFLLHLTAIVFLVVFTATLLFLVPVIPSAQAAPILSEDEPGTRSYPVTIVEVYDGDTFTGLANLGLEVFVMTKFRLARIDAWEVRGPEREAGLQAREFFLSKAPVTALVKVDTFKDRKGKYGRYIVEVFYIKDDKLINLNDELLEHGHAELYQEN